MLADSDPEVSATALENWESVVADITDDTLKAQVIVEGVKVLSNQEDVEDMLMNLDSMDDQVSVPAMVQIIEQNQKSPVVLEPVLEHYEFVTDEKYESPEKTREWLKREAL
jgi:hypothetical protein